MASSSRTGNLYQVRPINGGASMIRLVRIGLAWSVWGVAEAAYRVGLPYTVYNRLFLATDTLQGDHVGGPWRPAGEYTET